MFSKPAGMVCGFPSKYGFYLRSSPVICFFDTMHIIGELIWRTHRGGRFKEVIDEVIADRFADFEGDEVGAIASLQRNSLFRGVLFILGALP